MNNTVDRFAELHWTKDDIRNILDNHELPLTEKNIDTLFGLLDIDTLEGRMAEAGWDYMYDIAGEYIEDFSREEKEDTLAKRLDILDRKVDKDRKALEDKRAKQDAEIEMGMEAIKNKREEINELIALYNRVVELKIKMPEDYETKSKFNYGSGYHDFCANCFNHNLGFTTTDSGERCIGIWEWFDCDLLVDNDGTAKICTCLMNADRRRENSVAILRRFFEYYDSFRTGFLAWIDSLAE